MFFHNIIVGKAIIGMTLWAIIRRIIKTFSKLMKDLEDVRISKMEKAHRLDLDGTLATKLYQPLKFPT